MIELTLLTKNDCPLCDDTKYILETLQKYKKFDLEIIDIMTNPGKYRKYKDEIPVLFFNEMVICYHMLDMARLVPLIDTEETLDF